MGNKKLVELDPSWSTYSHAGGRCKALRFECPACDGSHSILVNYEGPSPHPSGAVWKKTGDAFETVSFSPSIDLTATPRREGETDEQWAKRCKFHGFVTNGVVTW